MLQEPRTSAYDLQFDLLGFPVRVAWGFWLVAALLGWQWSGQMDQIAAAMELDSPGAPLLLLLWVAAVFVSILVHELGHTLAMRYYGLPCRIVLYHFGGLAIPGGFTSWNAARQRRIGAREQIVISAAGPGLQLLLALVVWVIGLGLHVPMELTVWVERLFGLSLGHGDLRGSIVVYAIFSAILFPSTWWAVLNLAPILPLDGGNILRSGLMLSSVQSPVRIAHLVSVITAGLLAFYFLRTGEPFGIMFLLFAVNNWQAMQYGSSGY